MAEDGTGRNGTYTKHLLRYLKQPGLSLPDLFIAVGRAVLQETNGRQEPWVSFSPLPRFCFVGCEPLISADAPASAAPFTEEPDEETITWVQTQLQAMGLDPGPIDGIWGPRTAAALRRYQHREGLAVTGRLDYETLMSLRN